MAADAAGVEPMNNDARLRWSARLKVWDGETPTQEEREAFTGKYAAEWAWLNRGIHSPHLDEVQAQAKAVTEALKQ